MENTLVSKFTLGNILEILGSEDEFILETNFQQSKFRNQIIVNVFYVNEEIQSHKEEVFSILCSKDLTSFISDSSITSKGDIIDKSGNVVDNLKRFFLLFVKEPNGKSYYRLSKVCYIPLDNLLKDEDQQITDRYKSELTQLILTMLPNNSILRKKINECEQEEYLYLQNIDNGQENAINEVLSNADSIIASGKVIAEFMGEVLEEIPFGGTYIKRDGKLIEINYHKSWDKMMSVYHKITYDIIFPNKKMIEEYSINLMNLSSHCIDKDLIQNLEYNVTSWEKLNESLIPPNDKAKSHLQVFFRAITDFINSYTSRKYEYEKNNELKEEIKMSMPAQYEQYKFNDKFYNDDRDLDDQSLEFWNSI